MVQQDSEDEDMAHDMPLEGTEVGAKMKRKDEHGRRGQRTTKQKKKKKRNVEKALAVAERIQTKVKRSGVKLAKKKSAKTLWEK